MGEIDQKDVEQAVGGVLAALQTVSKNTDGDLQKYTGAIADVGGAALDLYRGSGADALVSGALDHDLPGLPTEITDALSAPSAEHVSAIQRVTGLPVEAEHLQVASAVLRKDAQAAADAIRNAGANPRDPLFQSKLRAAIAAARLVEIRRTVTAAQEEARRLFGSISAEQEYHGQCCAVCGARRDVGALASGMGTPSGYRFDR